MMHTQKEDLGVDEKKLKRNISQPVVVERKGDCVGPTPPPDIQSDAYPSNPKLENEVEQRIKHLVTQAKYRGHCEARRFIRNVDTSSIGSQGGSLIVGGGGGGSNNVSNQRSFAGLGALKGYDGRSFKNNCIKLPE